MVASWTILRDAMLRIVPQDEVYAPLRETPRNDGSEHIHKPILSMLDSGARSLVDEAPRREA
jgi:hypothetical protein